ncbi:arsenic resistance protein [Corynebacterium guangdongense]|uniref:ACR3 family arsenite efflux pump ArsB n=1 Tax=Corynebacterium guangdongense TaxID=1783348 RepID=A0ABU1ZUW1_9CORY|nr:bile acid:sodium symporter [Corynebacterium guangdongense]MDR7328712.1 ACR3 family arsenite efflux pump ArsB [Corynebacterium guangdongense]WJZ17289.1 Sodium Bile acid symporter family protein [Corynebacterium guangdongense]
MTLNRLTAWLDTHQVALYLVAMLLGAGIGLGVPAVAGPAQTLINPSLGLLLYATFLGIPFTRLVSAFRDARFLLAVLAGNFMVVPVVVWALTRPLADDLVLLVGACLVLLAPCIDYVLVFTGLAGGAKDRLLAATPLLMFAQMALLPLYLRVLVDASLLATFDPAPFLTALVGLIIVPLLAAVVTQALSARLAVARRLGRLMEAAMVPLMMLTLAVVIASQISGVGQEWATLARVVPAFAAFALIMAGLGWVLARAFRLDVPGQRAVVFSTVTRNSLVVLPIGLAMPAGFALVPLVLVTQTLVELIVMVAGVRLVPRLIR